MKFTLLVQGAPYSTTACERALKFAQAVVRNGHEIFSVFFYRDAVFVANETFELAVDEWNLQKSWIDFARAEKLKLTICVAAAQRRGISPERTRSDPDSVFELVGLGQFVEASIESHRVVSFS